MVSINTEIGTFYTKIGTFYAKIGSFCTKNGTTKFANFCKYGRYPKDIFKNVF